MRSALGLNPTSNQTGQSFEAALAGAAGVGAGAGDVGGVAATVEGDGGTGGHAGDVAGCGDAANHMRGAVGERQ